jgi:peptide subunit release factor 1 (eRF1)
MTDTDAARRFEEVGIERLLKSLAETVPDQAGADGTVVVGGPAEMTSQLVQRLRKQMNGRVVEDRSIAFHMSTAELRRATEDAATQATFARQNSLVAQVADLAGSGGRGALGRDRTGKALDERRVETLLLSRQFTAEHPELADFCVGAALEQDAEVEELGGDAATRLDRDGGGIGARLRFTT